MKINTNNYKNFSYFIFGLIGMSTLIVYSIFSVLKKYQVDIPFYFSIPSIPSVYAGLFWLFNNYAWKWKVFKKAGIIIADNLNGEWEGVSKSSYDKFEKEIATKLTIRQTATDIVICGLFEKSKSVSLNANFEKSDVDNGVALFYFYRNEPNYDAEETMAMHEGSVKLVYNRREDSLEGSYYSGRDRNNYGTVKAFRKKR